LRFNVTVEASTAAWSVTPARFSVTDKVEVGPDGAIEEISRLVCPGSS